MPALRNEDCILAPFTGRCIVKRDKAPDKFGVLWIPDKAKTYPTIGTVVAVGDDFQSEMMGKRVLFPRMSGIDISMKGQPFYTSFAYSELLAVIELPEDETVELDEETEMPLGQ